MYWAVEAIFSEAFFRKERWINDNNVEGFFKVQRQSERIVVVIKHEFRSEDLESFVEFEANDGERIVGLQVSEFLIDGWTRYACDSENREENNFKIINYGSQK